MLPACPAFRIQSERNRPYCRPPRVDAKPLDNRCRQDVAGFVDDDVPLEPFVTKIAVVGDERLATTEVMHTATDIAFDDVDLDLAVGVDANPVVGVILPAPGCFRRAARPSDYQRLRMTVPIRQRHAPRARIVTMAMKHESDVQLSQRLHQQTSVFHHHSPSTVEHAMQMKREFDRVTVHESHAETQ